MLAQSTQHPRPCKSDSDGYGPGNIRDPKYGRIELPESMIDSPPTSNRYFRHEDGTREAG
jgi:hypothetical protein